MFKPGVPIKAFDEPINIAPCDYPDLSTYQLLFEILNTRSVFRTIEESILCV
jgi:hypothetical protein